MNKRDYSWAGWTIGFLLVIGLVVLITCTGCGQHTTGNRVTIGKDVQTFNYAYIRLGEKDIKEGYVTQWRDYDDSDAVQIMIDGKYYLTHYSCVVMVADPSMGSLGYDSGFVNHN